MLILQTRADMSLASARAQLARPERRGSSLIVLGAAALAALSALVLAAAVILGPSGAEMTRALADTSSPQL